MSDLPALTEINETLKILLTADLDENNPHEAHVLARAARTAGLHAVIDYFEALSKVAHAVDPHKA